MEIRILGPLEVVDDGRTLRLGSRKQRALLALLVLRAGEVVSRDRLIEDLWHGDPPAAAEVTLRSHVSRLRTALGAERVLRRAPGYTLVLAPEELDAARCERLLAEGRDALAGGRSSEAAALLRGALAFWRGAVLADLAYEPFAQGAIARLDELRLTVLEERIEADLALARHVDLVGELDALVAEHPLRERLRRQQMLALYRSGRQAEALESYRQARRVLTDELGLEPSGALRDLQRAILAQDASLAPPRQFERVAARVQSPSAAGPGPFVGRTGELAELAGSLDEALMGEGRLCLVSGEPGIGKSRLVEQLASSARERGAEVLVGRCWEAGGAPAYWPWLQALRAYVRGRDPELLRVQLGQDGLQLAQILPELAHDDGGPPPPLTGDPEGARFRLFEATVSFLRAASLAQPLMVVLDDLHTADEPSLLLLRFVARELRGASLLVVGTYRDVDPSLRDPLEETLAELRREPVTRHVSLVGLHEADVASFVSLTTGVEPTQKLVGALHRATDGNPLFVGEVVRLHRTEEALESITDTDAWRRMVPEGVRIVIRRRLRNLSDSCRQVLVLASVLGREFELDALERVSDVSADRVLEALDEAAREGVVTDVPGQPTQMRFSHVLIRDTVYDALTIGRRVQLHRRVGDALEGLYADDLEPHLAELAHHFCESARPAVAEKALAYARRAAERSLRLLAFEEAARLFGVALRVLDNMKAGDDAVRCDLLLALGDAQARAGDTPAAKATFRGAAELAHSRGLSEPLARAALGYGGRFVWDVYRDDPQLATLLESALAALADEDSVLRARVLARLAGGPLRDSTADVERRLSLGAQALEMARRLDEPSTLAYTLEAYIGSRHTPDFTYEQVRLAKELIDVALQSGDLERALEGHDTSFVSSIELGDLASAHADLEAMATLAEQLRQPAQGWQVAVHRALLALLEGRFEEAEQLIVEARSLGERALGWDAAVVYGLQLYLLRRAQGRLAEVEHLVRAAAADNPTYPVLRCVLASVLAELGTIAEARAQFDVLAVEGFGSLPFDEEWEVSLCLLAETAARLGDRARAATLYALLLPYADRVAISYPEISLGPISRYLGILAAATGSDAPAAGHFEEALLVSERIGARQWLAYTQEDYAHLLARRGDPGDVARAESLFELARTAYRELGISASTSPIAVPSTPS